MKTIVVRVATDKSGSDCETSFEVEDNVSDEEIEETARDVMFNMIAWSWSKKS